MGGGTSFTPVGFPVDESNRLSYARVKSVNSLLVLDIKFKTTSTRIWVFLNSQLRRCGYGFRRQVFDKCCDESATTALGGRSNPDISEYADVAVSEPVFSEWCPTVSQDDVRC